MSKALEILTSMIPTDEVLPNSQEGYYNECSHEYLENEGDFAELDAMHIACGILDKLNFIATELDEREEMTDTELRGYATAFQCAVSPLDDIVKDDVELSLEKRKGYDPSQTKFQAFRERLLDNIAKVVDKILEFISTVYRKAKGFITKRFSAGARLSKRLNKLKGAIGDLPQYPKNKSFKAVMPTLRSSTGELATIDSIENWLNVMTKFDPEVLTKPFMEQVMIKPNKNYKVAGIEVERTKSEWDSNEVDLAKLMLERMEGAIGDLFKDFGLSSVSLDVFKTFGVSKGIDAGDKTYATSEMPGRYIMYAVTSERRMLKTGMGRAKPKKDLKEELFDTLGKDAMISLIDTCTSAIKRSYEMSNDINDAINAISEHTKKVMRDNKSEGTKVVNEGDGFGKGYETEKVRSHYSSYLRAYVSTASKLVRGFIAALFNMMRDLSGFTVAISGAVEEYVKISVAQYEGGDDAFESPILLEDKR